MSVAGLEGLLVGVLIGLFVRPILDSYLHWRRMKECGQTERGPVPSYPFELTLEEDAAIKAPWEWTED